MIDQTILSMAFLAGATDLKYRAPLLNRINVFPVADADTGDNMRHTLSSTMGILESHLPVSFDGLFDLIGHQIIRDARGNSGVIFSQFLTAFFASVETTGNLTLKSIALAAVQAEKNAYYAVSSPVEGTILTVISQLAEYLTTLDRCDNLEDHRGIEQHLAHTVTQTERLNPTLKRAGVVDAGALGFSIFASGLMLVLPAIASNTGAIEKINARISGKDQAAIGKISDAMLPAISNAAGRDDTAFKFCVNILLETGGHTPDNLADVFCKYGASVDVARSNTLMKLHVHTNDLDAVQKAAGDLGHIIDITVDDMARGLVQRPAPGIPQPLLAKKIRVIGDSSMSLTETIGRPHDIHQIENYVSVQGEMVRDRDLNRDLLFKRMRQGHLYKTAQCSPAEVRDFLDAMTAGCEHLIYVAVGNAYTGTQNTVRKIADTHPKKDRIAIIDTQAASGQQGLICLVAARCAEWGMDLEEIKTYLAHQVRICREYLVIDDLKHLARTGRIGRIKAALAGALSVKPIVGHGDSGAITHAKVRNHTAALAEISKRIKTHPGRGTFLVMVEYTDNKKWAGRVVEHLKTELGGDCEILSSPLSATSAVHMGPGTWGVAVTRVEHPCISESQ